MNVAFESISRDVIWPMAYPAPNFNLGVWATAPVALRVYKYLVTFKDGTQVMSSVPIDVGSNLFGLFEDGEMRLYIVKSCEELK